MKTSKKRIVLTVALSLVLVLMTMVGGCLVAGWANQSSSINNQIERLGQLKASYDNGTATAVNEQDFCDFSLTDTSTIKYNQLRTVGTHNSYKESQNFFSKVVFGLVATFVSDYDANELNYQKENITDQLNRGFRNFELDVARYQGKFDGFIVQHENVLDNKSSAPDFALALEEFAMWSDYNSNHMPIVVYLEIKEHTLPSLSKKTMTIDDYPLMHEIVKEKLGEKLLTPSDMLNGYSTLTEMREADDYLTLDKMQGKVLVMISSGGSAKAYEEKYSTAQQVLFTSRQSTSLFQMADGADQSTIDYVEKNYIVRTRADVVHSYSTERYNAAIKSGAQIISTDHEPSKFNTSGYEFYLNPSNKKITMTLG